MASEKVACSSCKKTTAGYICRGCWESFCFEHLTEHRQKLSQQLDETELDRDQFQQNIQDKKQNLQNGSLMKEINEWEQKSIVTIKQTAEECRRVAHSYINNVENQFIEFTEELKQVRQHNEFNEIDLNQLKNKLQELNKELMRPSTICLERVSSSSYIEKISIIPSSDSDPSYSPSNTVQATLEAFNQLSATPLSLSPSAVGQYGWESLTSVDPVTRKPTEISTAFFKKPINKLFDTQSVSTPTTKKGSRTSMFKPQDSAVASYSAIRSRSPLIRSHSQRTVRPDSPAYRPASIYPRYRLNPQ
ncbi:unnamed protein product [Adineta ricciae]|uniref:B box-type domain-containing protein n=1 Tax=Adineta ricciae TaxID=249248 RepID=A0A816ELK3_ADIRI|nr:unnamed protein product [Adineta ricciae]CAF1649601.1 unnamed protein product [Adineta ricciae]